MHIGYDARILSSPQRTGIGNYTHRMLSSLAALDAAHRFTLFFPRRGGCGAAPHRAFHAVVSRVPPDCREDRFFTLWYDLYLPYAIWRRGIRLFHGPSFLIPRTRRARTIVTVYDLTHEKYPQWAPSCSPEFARRVREAVRRADAVIATSQATRDDLIDCFHIDGKKVRVIYGGVDARFTPSCDGDLLARFRLKHRIPSPCIVCLSPLHARKNIPGLLEGFGIFKKRTGFPHRLVLAGKRYGSDEALGHAGRLGIADSFVYLDYLSDEELPLLYRCGDAFVFPSFYEGFGLPPLEAMACGVPVLSSRAGSLPEVLGDAARYFNPARPEEIADRLEELLGSDRLKQALSESGMAQARRYRWDTCARETLALYEELG